MNTTQSTDSNRATLRSKALELLGEDATTGLATLGTPDGITDSAATDDSPSKRDYWFGEIVVSVDEDNTICEVYSPTNNWSFRKLRE